MNTVDTNLKAARMVVSDSLRLVKLNVELARQEAKTGIQLASLTVSSWFVVAIVAIPAILVLMLSIAHLLQDETSLNGWKSEMIVAVLFLTLCVVTMTFTRSRLLKFKEDLL